MQIAILQKGAAWQDSFLLPSGRLQQLFASLNIQWQTAPWTFKDRMTDSAPGYSMNMKQNRQRQYWKIFWEYENNKLRQIWIRFSRSDFHPKKKHSRSYVTDEGGNMNRKDFQRWCRLLFEDYLIWVSAPEIFSRENAIFISGLLTLDRQQWLMKDTQSRIWKSQMSCVNRELE